jgi:ATP-dependent DNA helicase RecQ
VETPLSVLQRFWKHNQFRPLQEDIIASVLQGHDTLALLPTGGGKSICFQVPALLRDGICLVITPLIALMKDQVEQLKHRGISAVAIYSGMSRREIDVYLDNCIHGQIKFLYLSPERIQTELFIARVVQMKVALIAVDEAHCISQWGYDFRPPYLKIPTLRALMPDVPVIALTATATIPVRDDIMEKLAFRQPAGMFRKSFARDNLSFVVRKTENKERKLLEILQKVKGSALIYVRSRKATQDISGWLTRQHISASFYHAGLSVDDRSARQEDWIKNKTRAMVATNAFGMGIDKPDVRVVIHLDLPENIESYYQEAGRAGRDGAACYGVVLYQDTDIVSLKTKAEQAHPSVEYLKRTYQALANYFQLAVGSGEGGSYDIDLHDFSERFQLNQVEAYNALKKLEEEGLIQFNESFYSPSQVHLSVDQKRLYEFQIANAKFDPLIKMLLRLYGGEIFSGFAKISEPYLAKAMQLPSHEVVDALGHLHKLGIVFYEPVRDKPQVTFILSRQDAERLPVDRKRMEQRKELHLAKMNAIIHFVTSNHRCRMQLVQEYFNEETETTCNICDVCIERRKKRKKENAADVDLIRREIITILKSASLSVEQLEERIAPGDHELFVDVVREMVDDGVLNYDNVWKLVLVKQKT